MDRKLSTQEVADKIGVSKRTLLRWLYAGKVPEPKRQAMGGIEVRLWGPRDVQRARKFKLENYKRSGGE